MDDNKPKRKRKKDADGAPKEYHPFLFYLSHLPPWNGEDDYILELSLSVNVKGDAAAQLQFAEYLRKWLVGMVAGWVDDSVVNNVILGRAFTNLGFQYKRTSTSRGYIVIQRTAEEIRQRLRQLAGDG